MSSPAPSFDLPTYGDVREARTRLTALVRPTPVLRWTRLEERLACRIVLKCEQFQPTGAFKIRGATNALLLLDEDVRRCGVGTHSSGNHGAALAYAGRRLGIPVTVVLPEGASPAKVRLLEEEGARIVPCAPTQEARERTLARLVAEEGLTPVPPYDDARVIAGQGTACDEFLDDVPDLDVLLVPVGGGGLVSGSALALRARRPEARLFGVEPAGAADTRASLEAGTRATQHHPETISDGLRALVGVLPFALIRRHVDDVLTVTDEETIAALRLFVSETHAVIEPSSATVVAALLALPDNERRGRTIGLILSGGNVDPAALAGWLGGAAPKS
jgi:threonine dehydratase